MRAPPFNLEPLYLDTFLYSNESVPGAELCAAPCIIALLWRIRAPHMIEVKFQIRLVLFEEFFINLFDIKRVFDPTSYVVPNHKAGELVAVDQYNPFT